MATKIRYPSYCLKKMIASGILAAFIAIPCSIGFALLLAPFGDTIKTFAPWIFLIAAILIAWFSKGRWASVLLLIPFVAIILSLQALSKQFEIKLGVTYFLAIAVGPLVADLFLSLNTSQRLLLQRTNENIVHVAPDVKNWGGYFPNPLKILSSNQKKWVGITTIISSATFVFSPIAMTVVMGEWVASRIKPAYEKLTTVLAVKNGVTESTYIAEALIPLIAFGLPLSPVAAGPASPLFNAPPVFTVSTADQAGHNLHHLMSYGDFFFYGLMSIVLAMLIAYPLAMNYARNIALWVIQKISHEAVIAVFFGLILVLSLWEGGIFGMAITFTLALIGGIFSKYFGFNTGCQFMGFYTAILSVPAILSLFSN